MESRTEKRYRLVTGNQMVAEGAVRAGCNFFAGYPITPASGIYKTMIDLLQQRGAIAVSAPDEISALAYCVGASMRGCRAMTATSGPGWALMIETLQYALMTETPLVVAMVQRLGPSTGGATQGAQGDIFLTEFCTSGGYTVPVLCPSNARECYELTQQAFDISERLRTPVVILSDKEIGMMSERIETTSLPAVPVASRPMLDSAEKDADALRTYNFASIEDIPKFSPVGGDIKVTMTGSAHNKQGALKKNDKETIEVLLHLEEKILAQRDMLSFVQSDLEEGADTLLISYGITARTMRETVRNVRRAGRKISAVTVHSLFPIPEKELQKAAEGIGRIVIAEENLHGQYRTVLTPLWKGKEIIGVNKIGTMITPKEIEDAIGN